MKHRYTIHLSLVMLCILLLITCSGQAGGNEQEIISPAEEEVSLPVSPTPPDNKALRSNDGQNSTYYIHADGGSYDQCTGLENQPYPGSGSGQPCAWNHPFHAFPPGGTARINGGDTLIIGSGQYMIGFGALGDDMCSSDYPWECYMQQIPSGPDPQHPTRVLGAGWDSGCSSPPELWGTERVAFVVNLFHVNNVEVGCLDITDHSDCVEFHSGGLRCTRNRYPFGEWADSGVFAEASSNVYLHDLDILARNAFISSSVSASRRIPVV